ncbi:unnamed protein product [Notodromas monacha]|uniref:Uncharacterized protein n=1 Tax=Notodromas monacha TaxID=399045 RepID=A0A7R9C0W8_9CRUS|nr:unnamed protein product [Notodromas monacha]CAG0924864.1 unnamed protein product [Notodromas monacha]
MGDRMMTELSALDLTSYTAQELSDAMGRALYHVQHLSVFEIKPFDGGTTEFIHFLISFEELIVKGVKCGSLKFMFLKKYLRGEALYLVQNIGVYKDAYKDALEILKMEYASPSRIIREVMKKLADFPAIKEIAMTLIHYDMTADLNSFLLMALIKNKLPAKLHIEWDPLIRKMLMSEETKGLSEKDESAKKKSTAEAGDRVWDLAYAIVGSMADEVLRSTLDIKCCDDNSSSLDFHFLAFC